MVTIHPYLGVSKKPGYNTRSANERKRLRQRRFILEISTVSDKKLIRWLEANQPYQTALKRLIREQIERERVERRKKARKAE